MSTPSIKVGQGNWGIKAGNLLGYANTEKKFSPVEFASTRASNTATRVNASGNIEIVNANIPRIDYFGGQASLLVEPSAQNLAFHSTDWTNNWNGGSASGTTIITNSTISFAPDGTATANEIHPTSGNTNHSRNSNATTATTYTSGTIYTMSAFFKAGVGVGTRIQLTYNSARFSQNGYANFDLIAGTVLVVSGTTADTNRAARIENYGNEWYRCSFAATCTSNGTGIGFSVGLINASGDTRSPSFSGTVTDYLLAWGAQLETGSVATSYIPTTTAAVTRNADVVSVTGVAGLIGQTEGTIYAEVDIRNLTTADFARIITIRESANSDNFFEIEKRSSTQLRISARLNSGTTITFLTHPNAFQLGTNKIAFAYQNGNYAMGFNGVVATSSQAGMTASLNQVILGSSTSSVAQLNDRIRAASIYQTRLPNTTTDGSPSLQSITTL